MTLKIRPGFEQWDPSLITTALWLDANDADTFSYRSGSTELVSEWRDKSGNSRHCSQSTESLQPTRSLTAVNSKPAVTFTSHVLNNNGASLPLIARSVFIVFYENTPVDFAGVLALKPSSSSRYDFDGPDSFVWETGGGVCQLAIAGSTSASYNYGDDCSIGGSGATPLAIYEEIKRSGSGTVYKNGVAGETDSVFTEFSANSGGGYVLGRRWFLGALAGNYLDGGIAEIIYASSTLGATDREKVEGYLAHKWGLTSSLPSNHPYKTNAPAP